MQRWMTALTYFPQVTLRSLMVRTERTRTGDETGRAVIQQELLGLW